MTKTKPKIFNISPLSAEPKSPLQEALATIEEQTETLTSSCLLLKLMAEQPDLLREDFGNLVKLSKDKTVPIQVLMKNYSDSVDKILDSKYHDLHQQIGLAITDLVADMLFPEVAAKTTK